MPGFELEAFVEHLRATGIPEAHLPAYRRGARMVAQIAGDEPIATKHIGAALHTLESEGVDAKTLGRFTKIGEALLAYAQRLQANEPPPPEVDAKPDALALAEPKAEPETTPAPEPQPEPKAPPSDEPSAASGPLGGSADAPDGDRPPPGSADARSPESPRALPSDADLASGLHALPDSGTPLSPSLRRRPPRPPPPLSTWRAYQRVLLASSSGFLVIVALAALVVFLAKQEPTAKGLTDPPDPTASTPAARGPTKQRLTHLQLGLTLPPGWRHNPALDRTENVPGGGTIKVSTFAFGDRPEAATRALSCSVVTMVDVPQVTQSSTESELRSFARSVEDVQTRLKATRGEIYVCRGEEVVDLGARRAVRCRGRLQQDGREWAHSHYVMPFGLRGASCGVVEGGESVSPEHEQEAERILSSFEI